MCSGFIQLEGGWLLYESGAVIQVFGRKEDSSRSVLEMHVLGPT